MSAQHFQGVGALLERHRKHAPDKAALIDVEREFSLTFSELAATVDAIGRQLLDHGVVRGSRIALAGGNSVEKLLLWLGIWRVGAVVCPLDLSFTKPALAQTILSTLAPALIVLPHDADALPFESPGSTVLRHGAWQTVAGGGHDQLWLAPGADTALSPPRSDPGPADIAAICCTSGTSGTPKLVVYDHACYWDNGLDITDVLGFSEDDCLLEYRSFDWYSAQILSLLPFLQTGLTLCIARRFSQTAFAGWLTHQRITICAGVPAVLNILLEAPVTLSADTVARLRAITCSSAPLSRLQCEQFEARYGIAVASLYGSSEAGWMCASSPDGRRSGSVGHPVPRIGLRIVDADGADCAPGDIGQVMVDGPKLALGLLEPDGSLTPIRGAPFAMNDLALRDADGFIQVLGRVDDLIIRGGIKIAPREIEDILLSWPGVAEAVALGVPDVIYGQEPACFVVAHAGSHLESKVLLDYCQQYLPGEKTPKYLQVVSSLPRNARGKVVRDALRQEWWTVWNS